MTNYENLQSMSMEELAEYLKDDLWEKAADQFSKTVCKDCPIVTRQSVHGHDQACSYCEVNDQCWAVENNQIINDDYENPISWWLKQENYEFL